MIGKTTAALIFIALCFSSCSLLLRTMGGLKNPTIESKQSIRQFVQKNEMDQLPLYLLKTEQDSATIVNHLVFGLQQPYLVYDRTGQRHCFQEESTCSGDQIEAVFQRFSMAYAPCDSVDNSWDQHFSTFLPHLQKEDGEAVTMATLPDADYFVFWKWNKFMGGKKELKTTLDELLTLQKNTDLNIAVSQLNTDLLDEWGLEKGKKLKMTLDYSRKEQSAVLIFSDLPLTDEE